MKKNLLEFPRQIPIENAVRQVLSGLPPSGLRELSEASLANCHNANRPRTNQRLSPKNVKIGKKSVLKH